jgi:hypothetical protein
VRFRAYITAPVANRQSAASHSRAGLGTWPGMERACGFDRLDVEGLVGADLLEPAIFIFELAQLREIAYLETTVPRSPVVQASIRSRGICGIRRRLCAGFQFLESAKDLTLGETGLLHVDTFRGRSLRFHRSLAALTGDTVNDCLE